MRRLMGVANHLMDIGTEEYKDASRAASLQLIS